MSQKYRMTFVTESDDDVHTFETTAPNDEAAREEFEDAFPDRFYEMHEYA